MPFDPTLPHPLPEIDPKLFDELLGESKRFVDSCGYRVMSDELPTRFLDFWLIQKKAKRRFIISGTEGHPGYGFKAWMKEYALPEHLLQWPLLLCPLMAAAQAGLCLLLQKI